MITPYIATASQKIILTRFFEVILGVFTEAARSELPVKNIPLYILKILIYHAAPRIDNPRANPIPKLDHV